MSEPTGPVGPQQILGVYAEASAVVTRADGTTDEDE